MGKVVAKGEKKGGRGERQDLIKVKCGLMAAAPQADVLANSSSRVLDFLQLCLFIRDWKLINLEGSQ